MNFVCMHSENYIAPLIKQFHKNQNVKKSTQFGRTNFIPQLSRWTGKHQSVERAPDATG